MKLIKTLFILLCILNLILSETTQFGKKFRKLRHLKKEPTPAPDNNEDISAIANQLKQAIISENQPNPDDLPDAPIYLEGWVKYIHYRDNLTGDKPRSFFRNDAFYRQRKTGDDPKKKDSVI